jgi:hypothetical protein
VPLYSGSQADPVCGRELSCSEANVCCRGRKENVEYRTWGSSSMNCKQTAARGSRLQQKQKGLTAQTSICHLLREIWYCSKGRSLRKRNVWTHNQLRDRHAHTWRANSGFRVGSKQIIKSARSRKKTTPWP